MSNGLKPKPDPGQPLIHQIRLKGHLGYQWTDWFEGLTITLAGNGETHLTGPVTDQAALHGLLKKVRDLGMTLLSVNTTETGQEDTSELEQEKNHRNIRNQEETHEGTTCDQDRAKRPPSLHRRS